MTMPGGGARAAAQLPKGQESSDIPRFAPTPGCRGCEDSHRYHHTVQCMKRRKQWAEGQAKKDQVQRTEGGRHRKRAEPPKEDTKRPEKKNTNTQVEMEEDDTERQELDEIARSEGGLVAVTKVRNLSPNPSHIKRPWLR